MKTKKFLDLLALIGKFLPITGMLIVLLSITIDIVFFAGESNALEFIGKIGLLIIFIPIFALQFALPAGLNKDVNDILINSSLRGKLLFYLLLCPIFIMGMVLVNAIMVIVVNSIFSFMPDFHEAVAQGACLETAQTLRAQITTQALSIGGIAFLCMASAGFLYKVIRQKIQKNA